MKKLPLLLVVAALALCVSGQTHATGSFPAPTEAPPDLGDEADRTTELAVTLHGIAVALPRVYGEKETDEERAKRVWLIAYAIADASVSEPSWQGTPVELAAFLLTFAYWETRLSLRVHRQGPRKDTKGYAIGLTSLHTFPPLLPYSEWKTLGGIEGTERMFAASARVVSWARKHCGATRKDWPFATFSVLAGGGKCKWSGAGNRAGSYRRVLAKLESATAT